jgi:hypothetical protein
VIGSELATKRHRVSSWSATDGSFLWDAELGGRVLDVLVAGLDGDSDGSENVVAVTEEAELIVASPRRSKMLWTAKFHDQPIVAAAIFKGAVAPSSSSSVFVAGITADGALIAASADAKTGAITVSANAM